MITTNKWLSWGILVFAFVLVFFHRLSIGSVADQLTTDLSLDSIQIANLASMTFYGYALMQLPVGILVDTIGVRKICTWGMILTALGSLVFGMASHVYIAYLARLIVGIGTSVIIVSIMKLLSTSFPQNMYSTLSGFTSFFGNFGAFFATLPLSYLVVTIGWRSSFFSLGVLTLVLAGMIFLFVNDTKYDSHPEKIDVKEALKHVISNRKMYPDFFIMVFFVGSLTAVLGLWGNAYMKNVYGISNEEAAFYLSFITYGFILGAPIVGKLSDMLGGEIKKILIVTSIAYVLLWTYILIIQKGKPPLEQWILIYFLMGLAIISHILVFSNVKVNNPLKYTGTAIALINIGEFVGGGLVSLSMGIMIKLLKTRGMGQEAIYTWVMSIVLLSALFSFIAVLRMHQEEVSTKDG